MISVIHDNIINKTMIMFEHVFVDLDFRFHGCNLLTPKFGRESDLWLQLGEESV
jgi:hypothetical protein